MTPTEKAQDLVKSFMPYMYCYMGSGMLSNDYNLEIATRNARQCALIVVDEILGHCPMAPVIPGQYYESASDRVSDAVDYWVKVKDEINKL